MVSLVCVVVGEQFRTSLVATDFIQFRAAEVSTPMMETDSAAERSPSSDEEEDMAESDKHLFD